MDKHSPTSPSPPAPPSPFDDATLSAWLDGELTPEHQAAVGAWLRSHPEQAARVRLWAADGDALRARLSPLAAEPVPERWQALVQGASGARSGSGRRRSAPRWAWAQAAALLLAGTVLGGLVAGGVLWSYPPAAAALLARAPVAERQAGAAAAQPWSQGWTHRAALAHAVYVPEQRHPVEVRVPSADAGNAGEQQAQSQHLVRWLSHRLGLPVRLYDLRPLGFELVGGRLLPDVNGPSAQLMYQNAAGQRVTLYLRGAEPGVMADFAFKRDGELGIFYWAEPGYACAIVGGLAREQLQAVAESVYHQYEEAEARDAAAAGSDGAAPAAPPQPPHPAPRPSPGPSS